MVSGKSDSRLEKEFAKYQANTFPSVESSAGGSNRTTNPAAPVLHDDFDFEAWWKESEQRHLRNCKDRNCVARVCRRARSLPPLTDEEIDNYKIQVRKELKEARAKLARA